MSEERRTIDVTEQATLRDFLFYVMSLEKKVTRTIRYKKLFWLTYYWAESRRFHVIFTRDTIEGKIVELDVTTGKIRQVERILNEPRKHYFIVVEPVFSDILDEALDTHIHLQGKQKGKSEKLRFGR